MEAKGREINQTSTGQNTVCMSIDKSYFALLLLIFALQKNSKTVKD